MDRDFKVIPFPRRFPHSTDSSALTLPSELSTADAPLPVKNRQKPSKTRHLSTSRFLLKEGRKEDREEGGEPLWARLEREQAEQTEAVRQLLLSDLTGFGMPSSQADLLLREREWVLLAQGIAYVRTEMQTGLVRKPAGLFCWWLKRQGQGSVFR